VNPIQNNILKTLEWEDKITTAAVCVYPARVADAVDALTTPEDSKTTIPVASGKRVENPK